MSDSKGFKKSLMFPRLSSLLCAIFFSYTIFEYTGKSIVTFLNYNIDIEQRFVDGSSYVSYKSLNTIFDAELNVVLLGASVTRESSTSDDVMSKYLSDKFGKNIEFHNLGSRNQTFDESLAILATLGLPPGTIVIQQTSIKKLSKEKNFYREQFLNPRFEGLRYEVLYKHNRNLDVMIQFIKPELFKIRTPIKYYLSARDCPYKTVFYRELMEWCTRPVRLNRSIYNKSTQLSVQQKQIYLADAEKNRYMPAVSNYKESIKYIDNIIDIASQDELTLVFIDYPVSPLAINLEYHYDNIIGYSRYFTSIGIIYYDLRRENIFVEEDFQDGFHMIESGKLKMLDKFAQIVKDNIK